MFIPFINITKLLSYSVIARYGYEAFATIGNVTQYGVISPDNGFFDFTTNHILRIWTIFITVILIFLIISIITIKTNILEKGNDYLVLDDGTNILHKSKSKNRFKNLAKAFR